MPLNIPPGYVIETHTNPFSGKYTEHGIDNAVYLLYCDYSTAERWIKDSTKPESFFSNYLKAVQILSVLKDLNGSYHFDIPTPSDQLNDLFSNVTVNTNYFVKRYRDTIIKNIDRLKTEKAKITRIDNSFNILLKNYSDYLTAESKDYINSLRSNTTSLVNTSDYFPVYCNGREVNSLSDIRSIPDDDISFMRPLQKAATDHKRNGNMELAIECLKKSNRISDSINDPHYKLMDKEYIRIINYMKEAENTEEAEREAARIDMLHPEFKDKRISNLRIIREYLDKAHNFGVDIVYISTSENCPYCKHVNGKKFSISGKSKKYPKLPKELAEQGGFCPKCIVGISLDFSSEEPETTTAPRTLLSLTDQFTQLLKSYNIKYEDTPTFMRIHIYDNTNRKLGIVKITKPDMKITFKVPGKPTLTELKDPEDIKQFL